MCQRYFLLLCQFSVDLFCKYTHKGEDPRKINVLFQIHTTDVQLLIISKCDEFRDAHCSKLYDMIHIMIFINGTDTLLILITILQGTS